MTKKLVKLATIAFYYALIQSCSNKNNDQFIDNSPIVDTLVIDTGGVIVDSL